MTDSAKFSSHIVFKRLVKVCWSAKVLKIIQYCFYFLCKTMSETESKKLIDLRVVDLKAELEKRGLDKGGVKKALIDRLQKALESEGHDPKTYIFDIGGEKRLSKRPSTSLPLSTEESKSDISESDLTQTADGEEPEIIDKKVIEEENESESNQEMDTNAQPNQDESADVEADDKDEEESLDLTLDEEENIPEVSAETDEDNAEKKDSTVDETTASQEEDVLQEATTSTANEELEKDSDEKSGNNSSSGGQDENSLQKKSPINPKIVWITNVPKNTRANELKQLLSTCGKVVSAKVVVNARFPGSCCFGYITMGSPADAETVITKLNNTEFNGQIIKVDKFENVKTDNLSSPRKTKTNEETRRNHSSERKEEKTKTTTEVVEKDAEKTNTVSDKQIRTSPEMRSSFGSRIGRVQRRTPTNERGRDRFAKSSMRSGFSRSNVLTFDKIKEERDRQRLREHERVVREDHRRRHEESVRLREITRRQRSEADRLEREREKLRMERERIEREKAELLKLERTRQRLEREKLKIETMELQRSRLHIDEDRRAPKRPLPLPYRRDDDFDERKRSSGDRHFNDGARFEPPQKIKDGRYSQRDRSPHFRSMPENRDRRVPSQLKTDRDHYSESNVGERWGHSGAQSKFGSNNSKPWSAKGQPWRVESSGNDRWNAAGSNSSGRSMNQHFSGNSSLGANCPPPPGINNYSERFDYNKSSGMRKY